MLMYGYGRDDGARMDAKNGKGKENASGRVKRGERNETGVGRRKNAMKRRE